MNIISMAILVLSLKTVAANQGGLITPTSIKLPSGVSNSSAVQTTERYSLLEDDIMVYDMDESFQGEFLAAEVKRWPKTGNEVLIPYLKKTIFPVPEKEEALKRAISEFDTKTCIRFIERQNNETDYLEIDLDSTMCMSQVGRRGGKQIVRVGGCNDEQDNFSYGMVIHELMHSLVSHTNIPVWIGMILLRSTMTQ